MAFITIITEVQFSGYFPVIVGVKVLEFLRGAVVPSSVLVVRDVLQMLGDIFEAGLHGLNLQFGL